MNKLIELGDCFSVGPYLRRNWGFKGFCIITIEAYANDHLGPTVSYTIADDRGELRGIHWSWLHSNVFYQVFDPDYRPLANGEAITYHGQLRNFPKYNYGRQDQIAKALCLQIAGTATLTINI